MEYYSRMKNMDDAAILSRGRRKAETLVENVQISSYIKAYSESFYIKAYSESLGGEQTAARIRDLIIRKYQAVYHATWRNLEGGRPHADVNDFLKDRGVLSEAVMTAIFHTALNEATVDYRYGA